jgi:hypothetical protein
MKVTKRSRSNRECVQPIRDCPTGDAWALATDETDCPSRNSRAASCEYSSAHRARTTSDMPKSSKAAFNKTASGEFSFHDARIIAAASEA